ncbi:MAG: hypothetical protein U0Q12_16550 [Vicinamibacterales bacterium]
MHRWAGSVGRPVGALVTLDVMWRLASLWYEDRLAADWRPRSVHESQARLCLAGLTGPFWQLTHQD